MCDGWKPYAKFTNRIQAYARAHLLRESKDLAEKIAEGVTGSLSSETIAVGNPVLGDVATTINLIVL